MFWESEKALFSFNSGMFNYADPERYGVANSLSKANWFFGKFAVTMALFITPLTKMLLPCRGDVDDINSMASCLEQGKCDLIRKKFKTDKWDAKFYT